MNISGKLVDIHERKIYPALISVEDGIIDSIIHVENCDEVYIMPGLIDAHVHIESSMLTPVEFARTAVTHGSVGAVSDPHEIANVLGILGVEFMIENGKKCPFYFWFGAPSCVPATSLESSGAVLGINEVSYLLEKKEIKYLSEVMNFPGVINEDAEVIRKIDEARKKGKMVDGHAPGLSGNDLKKYIKAGISTDHECSKIEEAREKIALGMKIIIREGSAARNLLQLKELYKTEPEMIMLCSDDIHPEMLLARHINKLVAQLIEEGYDPFDVIRSCTVNPVNHYGLDCGLLRQGDPADMILVKDLNTMDVVETWIQGERIYKDGRVNFSASNTKTINKFRCSQIEMKDISVIAESNTIKVIEAADGELLTRILTAQVNINDPVVSDINRDILKIVVKDRYNDSPPSVGFIKGFGLRRGALASSVAHDSHNIIAAGTSDNDIVAAINEIVRMQGGLSYAEDGIIRSMQLDIAGIMANRACEVVAKEYQVLSELVKSAGSKLSAPYMTLSFMALLVIPELKISDRGLFDSNKFEYTDLFV